MAVRGFEIVSAYEGKGIALPLRGTAASAGYDLSVAESVVIAPGDMAMVPTGVKAYMEPDEVLYIHIRSSLAVKRQLVLMNSVGVVDADFFLLQIVFRPVGDFNRARAVYRLVILGNLIAFGQIRIEIMFARKRRIAICFAIHSQPGPHGQFQRAFGQHRHYTGVA